jgi:hypothetical protein
MKTILMFVSACACAYGPIHEIERARDITEWVHETIPYMVSADRIQEPAYTLLNGGDCADMSALVMWFLEAEGITSGELLLLDLIDYAPHHAIVRVWDVLFDPVSGLTFTDQFPLAHKMNHNLSWTSLLVLTDWK